MKRFFKLRLQDERSTTKTRATPTRKESLGRFGFRGGFSGSLLRLASLRSSARKEGEKEERGDEEVDEKRSWHEGEEATSQGETEEDKEEGREVVKPEERQVERKQENEKEEVAEKETKKDSEKKKEEEDRKEDEDDGPIGNLIVESSDYLIDMKLHPPLPSTMSSSLDETEFSFIREDSTDDNNNNNDTDDQDEAEHSNHNNEENHIRFEIDSECIVETDVLPTPVAPDLTPASSFSSLISEISTKARMRRLASGVVDKEVMFILHFHYPLYCSRLNYYHLDYSCFQFTMTAVLPSNSDSKDAKQTTSKAILNIPLIPHEIEKDEGSSRRSATTTASASKSITLESSAATTTNATTKNASTVNASAANAPPTYAPFAYAAAANASPTYASPSSAAPTAGSFQRKSITYAIFSIFSCSQVWSHVRYFRITMLTIVN